jgi:hypothetical protein
LVTLELGWFDTLMLVFPAFVSAMVFFGIEAAVRRGEGGFPRGKYDRPILLGLRALLYGSLGVCGILLVGDRGRHLGGQFVLDEDGVPERATAQMLVRKGGKAKVGVLFLRAYSPDGATLALHRAGFANGRKPLPHATAYWDRDSLRSLETLEVLATPEQVRAAVPDLRGVESRLLNTDGPTAVFERRDGKKVRVQPDEILPELSQHVGCVLDSGRGPEIRGTELIDPRLVQWPRAGLGCPSSPPDGAELLISSDAAYGDVQFLLTLRDAGGIRWQAPLPTATESEKPTLLGAVPQPSGLTLVSGDGPALVFSQLSWDDGSVRRIIRWD